MDLYVFPAATTSRAVLAFCKKEGLAPRIHNIDLSKGEHHQAPLTTLNPNRLVPVLDDEGFILTEAAAILRYLAGKTSSRLYPSDPKLRARVDELMSWFEANLYKDFGFQFIYPQLMPHHARGSEEGTRMAVEWGRNKSKQWLAVLDEHFLGDARSFLVGDELSIADYFGMSILSLGELIRCNFDGYANVQRWCRSIAADPAWMEVNAPFKGFAESLGGLDLVGLD